MWRSGSVYGVSGRLCKPERRYALYKRSSPNTASAKSFGEIPALQALLLNALHLRTIFGR